MWKEEISLFFLSYFHENWFQNENILRISGRIEKKPVKIYTDGTISFRMKKKTKHFEEPVFI